MPLVKLEPKSGKVEAELDAKMDVIRQRIKEEIGQVPDFPADDVLVSLEKCPWRNVDPKAADVVIQAATCPHEGLEARSNEICRAVAQVLIEQGFSVGYVTETWMQFIAGPWIQTKDGKETDSVIHPRSEGKGELYIKAGIVAAAAIFVQAVFSIFLFLLAEAPRLALMEVALSLIAAMLFLSLLGARYRPARPHQ
ncbi:MAG TPA: hypothetical protein VLH19_04020 [Patescibacteria group bacterium]|nr:hypothetical protein [Patescibacteria group bacterium]